MSPISISFIAMTLAAAGAQAPNEPQPAATAQVQASRAEIVEAIAATLEEAFVFPETGVRYAAALRAKNASGGYAALTDSHEFARAVTEDLQAVSKDGHLRVIPPEVVNQPGAGSRGGGPVREEGLAKAGWVSDRIAYARFGSFPGDPATVNAFAKFLDEHAEAETLIIDVRGNRGGGLAEMDQLFARIFAKETALVHMDTRRAVEEKHGSPMPDGPTLRRADSPDTVFRRVHVAIPQATPTKLRDAKVIVLTSGETNSAAEHFALAMKRTGRATLIGESTRGAGHFGGGAPLPGGFGVWVPVGRTFDPDTGQGWEGTGVAPTVAVPAAEALVQALVRSGLPEDQARTAARTVEPAA